MARKDKSTDDNEPTHEVEDESHNADDAPLVSAEDDTVDAEIVLDGDDPDGEVVATAIDTPDGDLEPDDSGDHGAAVPPTADTSSGGLAGPFAIIIGALVVVAALIVFLNRNNDAQTVAGNDDPSSIQTVPADQVASASETAGPVISRPISASTETAATAEGDMEAAPTSDASTEGTARSALLERAEALQAVATEGEEATADALTDTLAEAAKDVAQSAEEAVAGAAAEDISTAAATIAAMTAAADAATGTDETAAETAIAEAEEVVAETAVAAVDSAESAPSPEELTEVIKDAAAVTVDADDVASAATDDLPEVVTNLAGLQPPAVTDELPVSAADATPAQIELETAEAAVDVTENAAETALTADQTAAPETEAPVAVAYATAAQPAQEDAEAAISARLDDITSTVKQDVLAETEQVINQAIGKTERDVAELRTQLSEQTELQRESNERLASLSSKIETIQTGDLTNTRQSTLLLALADLSDSVESGDPFVRQLETVEGITPNARELAILRRYADNGLPTNTALRQQYQEAARNALSGVKRAEADGPMDRFFANMSGLFTVRKVGDVEGDSLSAVIARAENRLENDDVSAALRELNSLEGSAMDAFADWISAAEAKVDAKRRIEALEKAITSSRAG